MYNIFICLKQSVIATNQRFTADSCFENLDGISCFRFNVSQYVKACLTLDFLRYCFFLNSIINYIYTRNLRVVRAFIGKKISGWHFLGKDLIKRSLLHTLIHSLTV